MNFPLFRYSCKRAFPMWLVCTALMSVYAFAVVRMYDPEAGAALADLTKSLPQTMTVLGGVLVVVVKRIKEIERG